MTNHKNVPGRLIVNLLALAVVFPCAARVGSGAPSLQANAAPKKLSPEQVYESESPSVVVVTALNAAGVGELGTGSIIDAKGHVLTNAHVIVDKAAGKPYPFIGVYLKPANLTGDPRRDLANRRTMKALFYDRAKDLAILEPTRDFPSRPPLPLGDSRNVKIGQSVLAIGNPEQGGLWTMTRGIVSTVLANIGGVQGKNVFQTDASINRGNSGGPLIDRDGRVIGINTEMARKASDGLAITGVDFSIESNVAKKWFGEVGFPYAGVSVPDAPPIASTDAPGPDAAPSLGASGGASVAPATPTAPRSQGSSANPAAPASPQAAILTPKRPFSEADVLRSELESYRRELNSRMANKRRELRGGTDQYRNELQSQMNQYRQKLQQGQQ